MSENENEDVNQGLYVKDAEGKSHMYGEGTKRVKFHDKDNNQLTKSCHVCQNQHFKFKCQFQNTCSYSFCSSCLERYHSDLTIQDAIERCPVCRGVCSCRSCLRKMHQPNLMKGVDEEHNIQHAEHILKCCGPLIRQLLEEYENQVAVYGMKLEDVPFDRPGGDFVTCDLCCTSIPDLHFTRQVNDEEGLDVCLDCVTELKEMEEVQAERDGMVETRMSDRKPMRLMSIDMLKTMQKISAAYGNFKDQPVMPLFNYPYSDDPQVETDFDISEDNCRIKLHFTVKRPENLEAYIKQMNRNSQRMMKKLERETKGLNARMTWRDAGNDQKVRCIDASLYEGEDIDRLLSLCIWKGEPLVIQNVRGIMDWRPQVPPQYDHNCHPSGYNCLYIVD